MSEKRSVPANTEKHLNVLSGFIKKLQLVWLLFKDSRVPAWVKSVLPMSLLYLISPLDFVPDMILGLGQLDDISVILLGMALFVKLCPPELVEHYRNQLEFGKIDDDENTIDATYRVVGEE